MNIFVDDNYVDVDDNDDDVDYNDDDDDGDNHDVGDDDDDWREKLDSAAKWLLVVWAIAGSSKPFI